MASKAELFSGDNAGKRTVDTWTEAASSSNDVATIDRAGVENKHLHLTGVSASFIGASAKTSVSTLTITLGYLGTELVYSVVQERDLTFDPPLRLPEGADLEITLSGGGSGQVGHIQAHGFTL
jgi:hypothetical protein